MSIFFFSDIYKQVAQEGNNHSPEAKHALSGWIFWSLSRLYAVSGAQGATNLEVQSQIWGEL